jgi:hypothetical protein
MEARPRFKWRPYVLLALIVYGRNKAPLTALGGVRILP